LLRGFAAGAAGTAAMTAWQEAAARWQDSGDDGPSGSHDPWASAPAPAKVAKRILEGVFRREVPPTEIPMLTNVAHWGYGVAWGGVFGLVQGTFRRRPLTHGVAFGSAVWAFSYVALVPLGIYEPPWTYPAKSLALDLSYHLAYGAGVGAAFALT
jgi:hypothetical protein